MQREIKITFLGDLMYYSEFLPNPPDNPLGNIEYLLKKSDFVIANLETPISREYGRGRHTTGRYRFVAPVQFAAALKRAGVTHVSVANNHCLDQEFKGLMETLNSLNEVKLPFIGAKLTTSDDAFQILEKNGIRVGIMASTYGTNAMENGQRLTPRQSRHLNLSQNQELSNPLTRYLYLHNRKRYMQLKWRTNREAECWFDRKEFSFFKRLRLQRELKKIQKLGTDFIIAYPHWGGQHRLSPMNSARELGSFFFRHEANAVIGNHEHLVQIAEHTPKGLVAYCLGNTLGYHGIDERDEERLANYSIILHLYLQRERDDRLAARYTFSIAKCYPDANGHPECCLLHDLIRKASDSAEKEQLLLDQAFIYKRFTGCPLQSETDTMVEYPFPSS